MADLSALILAAAGTPRGAQAALALALLAAVLHALFGALQKGRHDPWTTRAAIDATYALGALPVALCVVPWPEPALWPLLGGAFVIHAVYKILQAMTYDRAPYVVVYPVVRGTGPLVTALAAGTVFGERFAPGQWAGLALLVGGIFGLAAVNLRALPRAGLGPALVLAVLTGVTVAAYTTWDALAIRAAADPFTFLAWFFVLDGLLIPALMWRRLRGLPRAERAPLAIRGAIGAGVAYLSFGSILLATRLDSVGEAAALRETSTVFAALFGWLLLGERTGRAQLALMAVIAAGAVVVEVAG